VSVRLKTQNPELKTQGLAPRRISQLSRDIKGASPCLVVQEAQKRAVIMEKIV